MPERSQPIPRDLANAFCTAVMRYQDGGNGNPDPTVGFRGQTEPISTICAMVEPFKSDQIPDDIFARLCSYVPLGDKKFKSDLDGDRSYSIAADCLLQLIQRRVTAHVRLDPLRRDRK